mgnify:CR=1 FL=1
MIVRVPASSANLGPGFDSFGIAWQMYNKITFDLTEKGTKVIGCDSRYLGENNLAVRAFRHTQLRCGVGGGGLCVQFLDTHIPVSRGLGSSAALIAAGVTAADALCELHLTPEEKLDLAAEIEGHPDNVAAARFGGLSASLMVGAHVITRRFPVSGRLFFNILIPPYELSTAQSRAVMPSAVSLSDAVHTLSRAALLPRALADGDAELIRLAMDDCLPQPYRFPLIKGIETAKKLSEDAGAIALCISGAGSSLLCCSDSEKCSERMEQALAEELPLWELRPVKADESGAYILA